MQNQSFRSGENPHVLQKQRIVCDDLYVASRIFISGERLDHQLHQLTATTEGDVIRTHANGLYYLSPALTELIASLAQPLGIATLGATGKLLPSQAPPFVVTGNLNMLNFAIINVSPLAGIGLLVQNNTNDITDINNARGQPLGIATLNASGQVPPAQLPPFAVTGNLDMLNFAILNVSPSLGIGLLVSTNTNNIVNINASKAQPNGIATLDATGRLVPSQAPPFVVTGNLDMLNFAILNVSPTLGLGLLVDTNTADISNIVASKAQPNGIATLDGAGKLVASQLPPLSITSNLDMNNFEIINTSTAGGLGASVLANSVAVSGILASEGQPNGIATLDGSGLLTITQLPPVVIGAQDIDMGGHVITNLGTASGTGQDIATLQAQVAALQVQMATLLAKLDATGACLTVAPCLEVKATL